MTTAIGQLFFNPSNTVPWETHTPSGNKEGMPIGIPWKMICYICDSNNFVVWNKLIYVSVRLLKILISYVCSLSYTRPKGLVPLSEVSPSQLIAYDHQRDLLPVMLANCSYSLEMGRETQLQYNWETLEKQIIDRFIRGRPEVNFDVSNLLYNALYWKEFLVFYCVERRFNEAFLVLITAPLIGGFVPGFILGLARPFFSNWNGKRERLEIHNSPIKNSWLHWKMENEEKKNKKEFKVFCNKPRNTDGLLRISVRIKVMTNYTLFFVCF